MLVCKMGGCSQTGNVRTALCIIGPTNAAAWIGLARAEANGAG